MATKTYDILVNAKTQQAIGGINGLTGALKLATAAAGALGVGLAAKKFIDAGNAFTEFQNKLRIVTTSQENLNGVTRELILLANATRTPLQETATLFQRLAMGTEEMGMSQSEVLQLTGNINKALKVSGANAAETASVILQLSQAFRSGRLQGEEFRSISENGAVILDLLAESMGRTKGELKKLASEGKLTSDVLVQALGGTIQSLDEDFAKLNITLPEALENAGGAISTFFGILDAKLGITRKSASLFDSLSDKVNKLNASMLQGNLTEAAQADLAAKHAAALRELEAEFNKTAKGAKSFFEKLQNKEQGEIITFAQQADANLAILHKGLEQGVFTQEAYDNAVRLTTNALKEMNDATFKQAQEQGRLNDINRLTLFQGLEERDNYTDARRALIDKLRALNEVTKAFEEGIIDSVDLATLRTQIEEKYTRDLEMFAKERADIVKREAEEKKRIALQERDDFINAEQIRRDELLKTKQVELMLKGKTADEAKSLAEFEMKSDAEKAQFAIGQAKNTFEALGKFNKQAFMAYKAFAIAQAIQNTALGATQALRNYPPPFSFIAAAAQVAAGLAQVATIRQQSFSGRRFGGPVTGGTPFMVGEDGPELFVPKQNGEILNQNQMGGMGGTVNVTFNIDATDADGFDSLLVQRKNTIVSMVRQAVQQGRLA